MARTVQAWSSRKRGGAPRRLGRAHRRPSVVVTHARTTNGRWLTRPFARLGGGEDPHSVNATNNHLRGALITHGGQISTGALSGVPAAWRRLWR